MATSSVAPGNKNVPTFGTRVGSAWRTYSGSHVHRKGMQYLKDSFGIGAKGLLGRGIPWAFMGYSAISGYREGGVWGAAKGVAENAALSYVFGQAMGVLGLAKAPIVIGGGIAAGAAAGGIYAATGVNPVQVALRPKLRESMLRQERVEMGAPVVDPYGNAATIRQRSLAAIQGSKINGRSALGNEASLMYRPYFR